MRNLFLHLLVFSLFFIGCQAAFAQNKGYDVQFSQTRSDAFVLNVQLSDFTTQVVNEGGTNYTSIHYPGKVRTKKAGWASLPYFGIPVQLPPQRNVDIEIINAEYTDISLEHPLLPSRGVIMRNQNPDDIPYEIDPESVVDAWYPAEMTKTSEPYIIRKVRGENIYLYPFRYNAEQQVLRVYTSVEIQVSENNQPAINPLNTSHVTVNREMAPVYQSLFVNYNQNPSRWSGEIGEFGDILVIYTSTYQSAIQDWITWKKQKGYHVDELQVSSGSNVVSDIQSAYSSNSNLLYVLLVGDWDDIQTNTGPYSAPVDPMAGCVSGSDNYYDIIVGRFSAENTSDVTAQGSKTILYERDANPSHTWYKNALGIASDQGAGDDNEYDYEQIDNIHDGRLLPTTYTTCNEEYDPYTSASAVAGHIADGVSVINYCGHGGHDYWVSSGYSTSEASSASNSPMFPYAFSVACIVGEFHTSGDCLAEALLKNPNGGAIATWMSSINQPWDPPMRGQDYANDLLIQGYNYSTSPGSGTSTTYGRTTFGSITFNAGALMISESSGTDDWDTYETWTIFGDPSFQIRTDQPKELTITNTNVTPGTYETQIQVDGSAFEGALVSLWQSGSQPASAITDASGNVSISHSFTGTVKLTVTGFNLVTSSEDHPVVSPDPPIADFEADQTTINEGESVQFTDLSGNVPTSWSWEFGDGGSSDVQNPSHTYTSEGSYTVTLTVSNSEGEDTETKTDYITVNPVTNPPVADFTADQTTITNGESVNFSDMSTNNPDSWEWTFEGGTPSTSYAQNPSVTYTTPGTYNVVLTAGNDYGDATETKTDYITVSAAGFSLDFEECADYSDDFSPWTMVDGDGLTPYESSDCDFPGEGEPIAFMAFNPSDAGFGLASAHGGERVGMSISPAGETSDDWLISEQLSMGENSSISFWALSPKPGTWGNNSFEVLVSTSGNATGDFSVISGASAIEAPDTWTEFTYDLSAYDNQDIYVAIHHVSTDKFMFWLDDISINTEWTNPLDAEFTADNTTVEVGETVNFTDLSTGAIASWDWDFGDGQTSETQHPGHSYASVGTYTVTLTVSDGSDSDTETKTDYITVTVPAPVADFSATPTNTCDGIVQFTDASDNADTWEWDFGDGSSSNVQNPEHTYTDNGTYTVSLTVTNDGGTDSYTQTDYITVNIPDASIDAIGPFCENEAVVTLTAATPGGTWGGNGVTGNTFDPADAGPGDHNISYEVSIGACTDTDTEIIHVDELPDISIDYVDPLCITDGAVTLAATPSGGTWSGDGVSGNLFDPASAGIGEHIISYVVTNGACTADDAITVLVGSSPDVDVDVTNASSATASDGSATAEASNGLVPYSFEWSNGDTDATMEDVEAGEYSLTVTDAAGCETVADPVVIDFSDFIEDEESSFAIYPNPAEESVFVRFTNIQADRIELVNMLGQSILSKNVDKDIVQMDLSSLESGMYFISIEAGDSKTTRKLIIE